MNKWLGRRQGKSVFQKQMLEIALNEGKRVAVCGPDGIDYQRRKNGLTLHEFVEYRKNGLNPIVDDLDD